MLINSSATASTLTCGGSGVVLTNNTTIGGSGNLTLASKVTGGYSLTYAGSGTLTLANTSTAYSGGTTINAGGTVQLSVASGAAGTGPIVDNGTLALNIAAGSMTNTISGPSTGIINIIETASDNLSLSGPMSGFTGTINCPTSPGGTAKAQILTTTVSLPSTATINVAAGGTLYVANAGVTIPCPVNLYGLGNAETYGAFRLENGALISGPVTLYGNTTMGNGQSGASKLATVSGPISQSGGAYGITFTAEPGTIVLSGANTFTGPVTNLAGSILSVNSIADPPAASSALGLGSILVLSNSTFQYTGSTPVTTTRTIYGSGTNNFELPTGGTMTLNGQVRSLAASTFTFIVTNSSTAGASGTLTLGGTADNSYLAVNVPAGLTVVCAKSPRYFRRARAGHRQLRERRHAPIGRHRQLPDLQHRRPHGQQRRV